MNFFHILEARNQSNPLLGLASESRPLTRTCRPHNITWRPNNSDLGKNGAVVIKTLFLLVHMCIFRTEIANSCAIFGSAVTPQVMLWTEAPEALMKLINVETL